MNKRTSYTSEFKFKIASLAMSETMTIADICSEHGLHATQVGQWKKELLSRGSELFDDKRKKDVKLQEKSKEVDKLYSEIGRLTVENGWLKKKSGVLGLGN